MPVPPAELTAEYAIAGPAAALDAARGAAEPSGIAREAGPDRTLLAGSRAEVLDTLRRVVEAAIEAGAHSVDVRLEGTRGQTP